MRYLETVPEVQPTSRPIAREPMPPAARSTIRERSRGEPGIIPADRREAVLRRFYRTGQSRHTPGSGLGLTLVAGVAGLHDMAIAITDAGPGCRIALIGAPAAGKAEIDFMPARSGS